MLSFTQPWGFLALLGVPLILLIHFLQRKQRRAVVTTLFLLEALNLESRRGNRFQRLVSSPPMWLQILAVLALTYLLTGPSLLSHRGTQRVALVLDSSASMSAFQEQMPGQVAQALDALAGQNRSLELLVIEDDLSRAPIYQGQSREDMLTALSQWRAAGTARSPEAALRAARHAFGNGASLLYVTDHPLEEVGYQADCLSLGQPLENVGFTHVELDEDGHWQVLVRNHSDTPQKRDWWLQSADGSRKPPESLSLPPQGTLQLQGQVPSELEEISFHLSPDAFALDDQMPAVRPRLKTLRYDISLPAKLRDYGERLMSSLPQLQAADETTDLVIASTGDAGVDIPSAAILFNPSPAPKGYIKGAITAPQHPLTEGLNWEALMPRLAAQSLAAESSDEVLLWKGSTPLILLRGEGLRQQLIFNFPPEGSGLEEQPAGLILVHRFCQRLRQKLLRFESRQLECRESIQLPPLPRETPLDWHFTSLDGQSQTKALSPAERATLSAPEQPGILELQVPDQKLLRAAVHFADLREADLQEASSHLKPPAPTSETQQQVHQSDPYRPIWILTCLAALLGSWSLTKH